MNRYVKKHNKPQLQVLKDGTQRSGLGFSFSSAALLCLATFIGLTVLGCGRASSQSGEAKKAAVAKVSHAEPPKANWEVPLVRAQRGLMSTLYQITVVTPEETRARQVMEGALDEIARLEEKLSEWRPDSEVSQINNAAGVKPIKVGVDTLANVKMALDVARWTGGAYDISWAALREFYLFQPDEQQVPDLKAARAKRTLVNFREILVDDAAQTVFLRKRGMAIGLGGIAKGWAADRASAILVKAGFVNHTIFAGGQVLVHGVRGNRKWRVGIQHPRTQDYFGYLEATDSSISTSGDYEHSFITKEGTRWHHIIDPKTGLPSDKSASVTLIAPSGLLADGIDTGCFVMGPERCLKMLAGLEQRVEAVILDSKLRLYTTPGTRQRLIIRAPLVRGADGREMIKM